MVQESFKRLGSGLSTLAADARSLVPRTLFGPVDTRIFFLHIQKCGGTSLFEALARLFRSANPAHSSHIVHLHPSSAFRASKAVDMGMYSYRQQLAHYFLQNPANAFVAGHFQVDGGLLEQYPEVDFITMFRDPVRKWYSHYFFNRYKKEEAGRLEMPLVEYLQTKRARDVGCDYVQLLTGNADEPTEVCRREEVFQEAVAALDDFAVVGALEHMDRFLRDFEEAIGVELSIKHRNRSPASRQRRRRELDEFSAEQREMVEEFCEPNIRFYREVLERIGVDTDATDSGESR